MRNDERSSYSVVLEEDFPRQLRGESVCGKKKTCIKTSQEKQLFIWVAFHWRLQIPNHSLNAASKSLLTRQEHPSEGNIESLQIEGIIWHGYSQIKTVYFH